MAPKEDKKEQPLTDRQVVDHDTKAYNGLKAVGGYALDTFRDQHPLLAQYVDNGSPEGDLAAVAAESRSVPKDTKAARDAVAEYNQNEQVAGGYVFQSFRDSHPLLAQYVEQGTPAKITQTSRRSTGG